jgi:putative lipoprotein
MRSSIAATAVLLLMVAGCSESTAPEGAAMEEDMGKITGTVLYRERIALPPGAEVTVELQDVSRADAPAEVLAKTRMPAEGGPPYPFELSYDPAAIDERMRYALRATITAEGRLLFTTDTHHPAFGTDEHELMVVRAARGGRDASAAGSAGSFADRDWFLADLGGESVAAAADGRRPSIHFESGGRVHGFAGCNTFTGTWETKGGSLVLSPLAMTRRACIEGMDTEQRYAVALEQVAGYEIEGERLVLRDADGEPLAVFE